jgi:hypothetical protein
MGAEKAKNGVRTILLKHENGALQVLLFRFG